MTAFASLTSLATIGPALDWRLALALVLLTALCALGAWRGRLGTSAQSVRAAARAVLQLLLVAGVLAVAIERVWTSVLFVALMLGVATITASGRVGARHGWPWIAAALVAGGGPVLGIIFATQATPISPPAVISICGIVIGGAMTATSLAVRRAFASLRDQYGEVEAAMALGFPRSVAIMLVIERGRPDALIPILDQTRTVGLVTLPGAFIGVLLGGGSPSEAAAAQLVVLIGLLAAETISVVAATRLVSAARLLPTEVRSRLPVA